MTDAPHNPEALAEPIVGRKRRFSLVWLFPLVAAAIGAWLVFTTLQDQGPTISIQFKTAAGLEAGKTKIKHKNVELGMVESVALSDDLSHILVTAALQKEAEPHLRDDTRFWVVRPRLGVGGVSGLDTLVSGAYIELDPGSGEPRREFTGLESPPIVRSDEPGREFVLVADRLGSLSAGSPIYFRGLDVGEVLGYKLADDDSSLRIEVFIRAPHDALVRTNTRFWNASGVSITMDADGVKVATESIEALLAGGWPSRRRLRRAAKWRRPERRSSCIRILPASARRPSSGAFLSCSCSKARSGASASEHRWSFVASRWGRSQTFA